MKSGLPLFLGAYPITPASSILEELARHKQFGVGTVLAIEDHGDDYKLTVRFNAAGTKKLLASFAGLEPA